VAIFRETEPNMPHSKWRLTGIGLPEIAFVLGAAAATVGVALVFVPAALLAVGVLLMFVAWRAA
jgi:hypothetical protein